ncbi:hypothetical protein A6S26_27210 [Nostoc sp. ATCC 43529]|nr:hypothetical protein A6S26_27210 [Nostoc sp. ATCC 43529]
MTRQEAESRRQKGRAFWAILFFVTYIFWFFYAVLLISRTYAKAHAVGAIDELPLTENKGFGYCLRKS